MADQAESLRLNRLAVQAMAQRRTEAAIGLLNTALTEDPLLLPAWMNLAVAKRMASDLAGALDAVDSALRLDPLYFPALLMRATLFEAMNRPRQAANAYNTALGLMPDPASLDEPTRRAIAHGLEFHASHVASLEACLRGDRSSFTGSSPEARRMSQFVDHLLGKRRRFHSEPTGYFYPGLPAIEFHDRADFAFLAELEAATPLIQAELHQVLDDEIAAADLEPYMQRSDSEPLEQWTELNRSLRWSAYHFAFYGRPYEKHRQKCPRTAAILDSMPQPVIQNRSPASLFSILQPRTHIPPHNGVANFRLLCHLPLILPPDCRFRCGSETRAWRMGEAFVFDDTIEHEAWNDSDQLRAVLIFDIWNPALSATERQFITESLIAMDRFNAEG